MGDDGKERTRPGEEGQIWFRGPGNAIGYYRDLDKTLAEAFDIVIPAVSDVWGLSSLARRMLGNAAGAVERSLDEVAATAELVAARLSKGQGPRAIVVPQLGFSEWDKPGGAFYDPERSKVFTHALRAQLSPEVRLVELKTHINAPAFATEAARIFSSVVKDSASDARR